MKHIKELWSDIKMIFVVSIIVVGVIGGFSYLFKEYIGPCQHVYYEYKARTEPDRYSRCYFCKDAYPHKQMQEVYVIGGPEHKVWMCDRCVSHRHGELR